MSKTSPLLSVFLHLFRRGFQHFPRRALPVSLCPARFDSFLPLIVFSGLYGAKIFLWLFLHFWIDKEGKLW